MNDTERIAVIDLGSNSARLIILEIASNNSYHLVFHKKEGVRLCEGLQSDNLIKTPAWQRALNTLKTFSYMCQLFKATTILPVATAAVRNALNGQLFIDDILKNTKLKFKIISGQEEAFFAYLGVVNTLKIRNCLIFDLGGGSTELILVKEKNIQHLTSLPFGAVTLNERFSLNNFTEENALLAKNYINNFLQDIPWFSSIKNSKLPLVGIGGTSRNIAKLNQIIQKYIWPRVHNYKLPFEQFIELWQQLTTPSTKQTHLFNANTGKSDIIISGTMIVKYLFKHLHAPELTVSGCGLREGLFLHHFMQKKSLPYIQSNILKSSIYNILYYHNSDIAHAKLITQLALKFFDSWQEIHKIPRHFRRILYSAAMLHDIGITINYYDHPRHSSYIIESANLFGLSHREQLMTSVIAGSHERSFRKIKQNKLYKDFFHYQDWQIIDKLSVFLALAEALDFDQTNNEHCLSAYFENHTAFIKFHNNKTATNVALLTELNKCSFIFKKKLGFPLKIV